MVPVLSRYQNLTAALALAVSASLLIAEGVAGDFDPRPYGIDLPAGPIVASTGETVTTATEAGDPVVGKIHVRVGEGAVILLPDGQLVARAAGKFAPTERPFEPTSKEQIVAALTTEFSGFKITSTNHYIFVSSASEEFTFGASRILETMLPGVKGYAELNRIPVQNPKFPLVVVMFKTEKDFQKYRRMPDGVVAYYHPLSNRVFMYEQSKLAEVRPDLAIQQAISTIAHEGVHQILHNIGVQQRLSLWPMWLAEGLAEFFAPTSVGAKLKWKGAGQVNDLRMFELEQYLKSRAANEPDGQLVEKTVLAGQLTSTGYASAWALTHHLAKNRRTEFDDLLRAVSALGPFEGATDVNALGFVRSNRDLFVKEFGDDFKELERRLVLHLKKLPYTDPFQDAPHFVATLISGTAKKPQRNAGTFQSPQLAAKWIRDTTIKLPEAQRNSSQSAIRVFPNRPQAEAFATQFNQGR
jgi:Protein of unknown function (DUF1570)